MGLLALIHNHIDTHYTSSDLDPEKIAALFDISVRHLHRLFAASGATFSECLLERRLIQAQRMLINPNFKHQTIMGIAFNCGFRDINHFGRRFRERYGTTPGECRQNSSYA